MEVVRADKHGSDRRTDISTARLHRYFLWQNIHLDFLFPCLALKHLESKETGDQYYSVFLITASISVQLWARSKLFVQLR